MMRGVDISALEKAASRGESDALELKKSTGQLTRAGETVCGFLNGKGGRVVIGVTHDPAAASHRSVRAGCPREPCVRGANAPIWAGCSFR